jgi:hypothetical protein
MQCGLFKTRRPSYFWVIIAFLGCEAPQKQIIYTKIRQNLSSGLICFLPCPARAKKEKLVDTAINIHFERKFLEKFEILYQKSF